MAQDNSTTGNLILFPVGRTPRPSPKAPMRSADSRDPTLHKVIGVIGKVVEDAINQEIEYHVRRYHATA